MCPTFGHFEDARVFHVRFHRQQLHAERAAVVPSFGPGSLIINISLYHLFPRGIRELTLRKGKKKCLPQVVYQSPRGNTSTILHGVKNSFTILDDIFVTVETSDGGRVAGFLQI